MRKGEELVVALAGGGVVGDQALGVAIDDQGAHFETTSAIKS
jgi:hypothetical protein